MPITITVAISGEPLHLVRVVNMGPPRGEYDDGDGPLGGGRRVYHWECGGHTGQVIHERRHGAALLAAAVLEDIDRTTPRRQ